MPCPSVLLWDIFYTNLSLLDNLSFLLMNFRTCSRRVLWNAVDKIHSPPQSPALESLTLQGRPSSIKTPVLRFPGQVWTAFCRPVQSRALGSPPVRPGRGPHRWEHWIYVSKGRIIRGRNHSWVVFITARQGKGGAREFAFSHMRNHC